MKKYFKKVLIVTLCLCTIIGSTNIGECDAFGTIYYQIKIISSFKFGGKMRFIERVPEKTLKKYTIYEAKISDNPGGVGKNIIGSSISDGAHYVKTKTFYKYKNGKKYKYYGYQKIRKVGDIYIIDKNVYDLSPSIKSNKVKTYVKEQAKAYVLGKSRNGVYYNSTKDRKMWILNMSLFGKVKSIKRKRTLRTIY